MWILLCVCFLEISNTNKALSSVKSTWQKLVDNSHLLGLTNIIGLFVGARDLSRDDWIKEFIKQK